MNKIACLSIVSKEYDKIYQVHLKSLQTFLPNCDHLRYKPDEFQSNYKDIMQCICSIRPKAVLRAFKEGYETVIFLGADMEFFTEPTELFTLISSYNAIVTPHITNPLPNDGKFPNNESIAKTGHINSDLVVWKNCPEIVEFLKWQAKEMETKCISSNEIFLDQTWLNFLPFFVKDVYILLNPGYNVAYWCYNQRGLHFKNNKWLMSNNDPLVCFQYSGFDLNNSEIISKYQNRYRAEGDFLEFLKDYAKRIK